MHKFFLAHPSKSLTGRGFSKIGPRKIQMSKSLDIKILRTKRLVADDASLRTVTTLAMMARRSCGRQGQMSQVGEVGKK
jgi:hypothetical protein